MPGTQSSPLPQSPRIAVVAVHGVADQNPGDSCHAIANLIASVDGALERESRYRLLHEEKIRVPVRPLWERRTDDTSDTPDTPESPREPDRSDASGKPDEADAVAPEDENAVVSALKAPFRAASGKHRRSDFVTKAVTDEEAISEESPSLRFMDQQLRNYQSKGPSATYDTVRISAIRDGDDANVDPTPVDIFEMYWADLSRAHSGIVRIAAELYQLFLHLSNLGSQLLDFEVVKRGTRGGWGTLARNQGLAVGLLTLVIPIGNMFMLGTGLILLAMNIRAPNVPWIAAIAIGLMAAIGSDTLRARVRPDIRARFLLIPLFVSLTAGAVVIAIDRLAPFGGFGGYHMLAIAVAAIVAAAFAGIIRVFEQHQPGARAIAAGGGVLWVIITLIVTLSDPVPNTAAALSLVVLWILEFFFALNSLAWLMFLLITIMLCTRGFVMSWRVRHTDRPACNAITTARITLIIPALGVLFFTVLSWIGLYFGLQRFLPRVHHQPALTILGTEPISLDVFARELLSASLTSAFLPATLLIGIAVIIALWSFMPILWTEVRPPKPLPDATEEHERAERMGRRLSQAYRAARMSGYLLFAALVAFFIGAVLDILHAAVESNTRGMGVLNGSPAFLALEGLVGQYHGPARLLAHSFILKLGAVISVSAVSLFALQGRLQFLALGLRPILDIALDVDNYLRLYPKDNAPRARIVERFSSLLRYVMDERQCGVKYDAIVFIAHSQGTVITADLLRYVRNRGEIAEKLGFTATNGVYQSPTSLYFFTMGSPLRQLYYPRFPVLYDWIGQPKPSPRSAIADNASPIPGELGVRRWVNVYRSGDYVGRNLWLDEAACPCVYSRLDSADFKGRRYRRTDRHYDDHPELQVAEDVAERRREACIGAGAHTHYWDDTAPDVAAFLDDLIAEAVQSGKVVPPGRTPPRNWAPIALPAATAPSIPTVGPTTPKP